MQRLVRKQDVEVWEKKGWLKVEKQPRRAREVGMTVDIVLMELIPPKPEKEVKSDLPGMRKEGTQKRKTEKKT